MDYTTIPLRHAWAERRATGRLERGVILPGGRAYRLERLLHLSELSAVYLATDLSRQQQVIIKEVGDQGWQPAEHGNAVRLLEREGQMLCLLKRWQIPAPRYLDLIRFQGRLYLVMTRIAGQTLELLAERGQSTPQDAIRIIVRIAQLVQRLHAHGYVHHDIKPSNVIIQPDGQPMLIDYGSAQRIGDSANWRDGSGTKGFMSLDQIRGNVLPSNDLFALAATLHHLVPLPDPHVATILDRVLESSNQPYHSLAGFINDLQRHEVPVTARKPRLTATARSGGMPQVMALLATLLVCTLFTQQLRASQLVQAFRPSATPTLVPILRGVAVPMSQDNSTTPESHVAPPVIAGTLLRACYADYQTSRVAAFAQLSVDQLRCVEPGAPLWRFIQTEIDDLRAQHRWRQIIQHSEVREVTIGPSPHATMVVAKTDTRYDFPLGCDALAPQVGCQPSNMAEDECYVAVFHFELTAAGWRLTKVTLDNYRHVARDAS